MSDNKNELKITKRTEDLCDRNITVNTMLDLGRNNKFPKKVITIDDDDCYYTPILNFFDFQDKFKKPPTENIKYKCKICETYQTSKFGKTTNLNKHLKTHDEYKKWHGLYQKHGKRFVDTKLDSNTLTLIKYFIASNTALSELKNKWLRELLADKFDLVGPNCFRDIILPKVYQLMHAEIERR
jgi:hypothetical protein